MTWDSDDDRALLLCIIAVMYLTTIPAYAEEEYLEGEEEDPEPEDESESAPNEHESGSATSGSPTPEPVATSLDEFIKTAPVEQIRSLLTFICQKHESGRKLASGRLLAPLDSDTGRKRKAFEKCKNCDEEYNVTTNYKGDCVYHPGKLDQNGTAQILSSLLTLHL